jgi:CRP/FNR family transcriptional regulator, cyclic AMP receptor protein
VRPASPSMAKMPKRINDVLGQLRRREDVLGRLSDLERGELFRHGTVRRFNLGEEIFPQAGPHAHTFFILNGIVSTTYLSYNTKEYTVAYWTKGDLVGGPYFLDDSSSYLWSGRAVEQTELLAIPGKALRDLALRMPALGVAIAEALCFKIHWFSLLLQIMGTQSVEGRLCMMLLGLGAAYGVESGDGILIAHAFTQADLAKMVGVSRQWLNSALGQLQKRDVLAIIDGKILIRDRSALQEVFDPDDVR